MRNRFYIPSSTSQRDDLPLWDLESVDLEPHKAGVPVSVFSQHTEGNHEDNNLGFRKELEFILTSREQSGKQGGQQCSAVWSDATLR